MSLLHAPTYRWSVEDYEELSRAGFFDPDERMELLNGEIIVMSPIGYRHAMAVNLLNEFFTAGSRGRYLVAPQNPFNLDKLSQPQPDLALLDRGCRSLKRHAEPREILLVIEVADSTVRYDREDKGTAYAARGVREYWLLNLEKNCLEVFRDPQAEGYAERLIFDPADSAAPLAFPDLVLKVGEFLP